METAVGSFAAIEGYGPATEADVAQGQILRLGPGRPLALESGLSIQQADALRASERTALAAVQAVIVTSAATARLVASDYGVPAERITVVRPGSDQARFTQGSQEDVVRLLSVGAVVPRKGARLVAKTLDSAIANAENNNKLKADTLRVKEAVAGTATTIKRFTPKARGSAGPILKRRCHIKITLSDE